MIRKYIIIAFVILTTLSLAACIKFNTEAPQCYWMENYSNKFEWVPANAVYQRVLTKLECFDFDSCDGGKGRSGGGCYKWAISAKSERLPW